MATEYIKHNEFVRIAIECESNINLMTEYIRTNIHPNADKKQVAQRLAHYRRKGHLPLDSGNAVSIGEVLKGTSTLYDDTGNIVQQWIKTDVDKTAQLEAFENAVNNICERVIPIAPVVSPLNTNKDLLVKIPIADAHIGLLTWHKEVGVDMDLTIAKSIYTEAMSRLVASTPDASTCLLLDLGDTIHSDDQSNQTKANKHQLDVDGRYDKLYDMTFYILCVMIDIALTKYETIIFRKTRGNHDPDASIGISAALAMRYRDEPRVTIERSPSLFWWMQFGKTLHFSTHGHTVRKQSALPEIAAHDCKKVWSECKYVYIDTGHVHHQQIIETRTAVCESHNSLTAGDSYNYGHGYRALRNLKAITYHKDYGEIARDIVSLQMLQPDT